MNLTLYLIRHGKTEASLKRQYCGATDIPLCEEGIAEIREFIASGIYNGIQADRYYTSGLKRADETLSLIYGDVPLTVITKLAEMNFGRFEMHTHDELDASGDKDYQEFLNDTTGDFVFPGSGGESANSFYERVDEGYAELLNDMESYGADSALLVAHGGSITRFIQKYTDVENFYDAQPLQGRGFRIRLVFENGEIKVLEKEKI
ncbi:MAG: histidine phosphatase family protein [Eubacteriales bacterium]|nr:histidine phosphatase family protein [Eubacteriales bacterium]